MNWVVLDTIVSFTANSSVSVSPVFAYKTMNYNDRTILNKLALSIGISIAHTLMSQ